MTAFDTNVLIYACDRADPGRQARALDLIASTSDGVLLWQVASEFIEASRKLAGQGFTAQDARKRLNEFLSLFPLVPPSAQVPAPRSRVARGAGLVVLGCDGRGSLPGVRGYAVVH